MRESDTSLVIHPQFDITGGGATPGELQLVQVDEATVAVTYGTVGWDVPTIGGTSLSQDTSLNTIGITSHTEVFLYLDKGGYYHHHHSHHYHSSSYTGGGAIEVRTEPSYTPVRGVENVTTMLLGIVEWDTGQNRIKGVASSLSGSQWVTWCGNWLTHWERYT